MNQEQAGEILRANVKNLSEPLKSAVEFALTNFFAPNAADLAKKFLASLPSMTTEDAELKSRIDSAYFTLMNDEKIWLSLENFPHEEWRDIFGYESLYQISNYGRVKSFQKGKPLIRSGTKTCQGYFIVSLTKRGIKRKVVRVHVLVAQAFIPNLEYKPVVNHMDGNKLNNRVSNLEWTTQCENVRHACAIGLMKFGYERSTAKLTAEQVRYIRRNYIPYDKEFGLRALARNFDVHYNTIAGIIRGDTYKNIT